MLHPFLRDKASRGKWGEGTFESDFEFKLSMISAKKSRLYRIKKMQILIQGTIGPVKAI